MLLLLPVMPCFGLPGEGEEEEVKPLERPSNVSEEEWNDLSDGEKEGLLMTGEGELGEVIGEGDGLTDEELAAIATNGEPDKSEEDAAAVAAAASTVAEVKLTSGAPAISDDELLAYQPAVTAAEIRGKLPKFEVPAEIQEKIDALDARFENGLEGEEEFLSRGEYNKQRDALTREANEAIANARLDAEETLRADLSWEKAQGAFYRAHPEYVEAGPRGAALFGALNEAVKALNADPANAVKSDMQIMILAHKTVAELFGFKPAATPAKPATPTGKPAAALPTHQTLAHVPASDAEPTGDPFAALDRLSGEAYETALERLTPDQRDRYLSRA